MNAPDYSDEVGGADDLTPADLEAMGIEVQPASAPSKSYIRWKPIAMTLAKQVDFWKMVTLYVGLAWFLTFVALCVAVAV